MQPYHAKYCRVYTACMGAISIYNYRTLTCWFERMARVYALVRTEAPLAQPKRRSTTLMTNSSCSGTEQHPITLCAWDYVSMPKANLR